MDKNVICLHQVKELAWEGLDVLNGAASMLGTTVRKCSKDVVRYVSELVNREDEEGQQQQQQQQQPQCRQKDVMNSTSADRSVSEQSTKLNRSHLRTQIKSTENYILKNDNKPYFDRYSSADISILEEGDVE